MDKLKPINEFDAMSRPDPIELERTDRMNEFENKLRQILLRRPAPPGLKRRIMDQRNRRRTARFHSRVVLWQRLAACFVLAAALGGGLAWRRVEKQRKGEAAREQVLTALRITNHALNQIEARLAARDRADRE
jgi:hypothetical protein